MIDYAHIARRYGLRASLSTWAGRSFGRTIHIPHNGVMVALNGEAAAAYHILNSIEKIEKLVGAIPGGESGPIVDVGANCGLFSVFARKRFPKAPIFAFEPSPALTAVLQENLSGRDVKIIPKAVSDRTGLVNLFVNDASQQTNSILRESVEQFATSLDSVRVESTTLDAFVEEMDLSRIHALKLDIQGAESLALKSGQKAFAMTRHLLLEVSFLDRDVFELLDMARSSFPHIKVVNLLFSGADLLFSREHPSGDAAL